MPTRVLVIGAGGFFGRRLVQRLSFFPDIELLTPSRGELDATLPGFAAALARLAPHIVVNTAGPFQGQDHRRWPASPRRRTASTSPTRATT